MQTTARNRWTALALLAAIEFMILLDTSIVNIALPSIQSGLHFSEADLGWVQNLYQLIFGSLLLFGGRAADLFGRRKLYLLGLALFMLGSLLAGLASTAAILLMARAMQGLGAAAVIPAEQSLLSFLRRCFGQILNPGAVIVVTPFAPRENLLHFAHNPVLSCTANEGARRKQRKPLSFESTASPNATAIPAVNDVLKPFTM